MATLSSTNSAPRHTVEPSLQLAAPRENITRLVHRGSVSCAALLILLAVTVLLGWIVHSETLVAVLPGRVGMKPNTATCFLLSGLALLLPIAKKAWARTASRLASSAVLLLGGLSLAEYILRVDLHIDQLVFRDTSQLLNPGRMAQVTSVGFCLAGLSLLLAHGNRIARRLAQLTGSLLTSLAYTSIVSYVFGVPLFYGSFRTTNTMALHTGVGMLLLGCGILVEPADSTLVRLLTSSGRGGWLVRRFLPLLAVLPVLLGYLFLYPAVNFGELRFGMALFALTLVLGGTLLLLIVGIFFNRAEERQHVMAVAAQEATAAIAQSERELRLVTDHLPLLLSYFDLEGRYLRVNRTYEEWLGLPAEEIVGHTIRELLGEDYWERTRATREEAKRGAPAHIETMYPTVHGDRRALVTYAPDLDETGTVRGFACMILDVEEQRRAEAALRQSEKLAAVGRLASSIAHEINNPIDAAMNLLFLVKEQTADQGNKNLLEIAESELKRVANIAGQTLSFHKQRSYPEPISPGDLFASVLTLHDGRLRHRGISVARRERASERVECMEGEIRQVLNNLVSNAVDAMGHGGRLMLRSRVATEWRSGRRGVMLTIADNGCGMDAGTLAQVFESFFTTKGIEGTGLGLWISAEILSRHDSRMLVRSCLRPDKHGTVFTIFLPFEGPLHHPVSHPQDGLALARQMEATIR